jgi:hypothetical protein
MRAPSLLSAGHQLAAWQTRRRDYSAQTYQEVSQCI